MKKKPQILDEDMATPDGCRKTGCPTEKELKDYPKFGEEDFDRVDEKLALCPLCQSRAKV